MAIPRPLRRSKKPARQPVQSRSRDMVEAIIEAGARILGRDGWRAFNTNAIARTAGVSIGSVYEYFGNKGAILDVIIDRHLTSAEVEYARLAKLATHAPSLDEIVRLLIEGFIAIHRDDPKLHRILSTEVPVSPQQRGRLNHVRNQAIASLGELLRGQVESPQLSAAIMIDTVDALTHKWFVDELGVPASPDQLTRELERLLCAYIHCEMGTGL